MSQPGRYELKEEIGQGGFAVVYRGVDTQLGRDVALKELRPILLNDAGWVKRFRREARAIARLDHPHIVPIYDIYEPDHRLYLVMRLVNGPALDGLISSRQSTNHAADYSRISVAVDEEVRTLEDHLEALEEVKFGGVGR